MPEEIWRVVFSFTSIEDLLSFQMTAKRFYYLVSQNVTWNETPILGYPAYLDLAKRASCRSFVISAFPQCHLISDYRQTKEVLRLELLAEDSWYYFIPFSPSSNSFLSSS